MAAASDLTDETLDPAAVTARPAGSRLTTLVVAAAVPAVVACVAWWLGVAFVAAVAAGGVIVGPLVALRRAGRVAGPGWLGASIVLGIQAPLLVCLVITAYGVATSVLDAINPAEGTAYATWAFAFVLPYGLVFGTPVAVPVAIGAGFLAHRVAGMLRARARRHLGALAVATVAASVVTVASVTGLLARALPGATPIDWASITAAARLTLTVENLTTSARSLAVGWEDGNGGFTGVLEEAPPCSAFTDLVDIAGAAWSVTEVSGADFDPLGPPLTSSASWPGHDPAITIRLGTGGRAAVLAGSRDAGPAYGDPDPEPLTPCP